MQNALALANLIDPAGDKNAPHRGMASQGKPHGASRHIQLKEPADITLPSPRFPLAVFRVG
jgi:hypothetical protein